MTNNRIGVYADRTGQVHLSGSSVSLNDTGLFTLNAGWPSRRPGIALTARYPGFIFTASAVAAPLKRF